ncbi:sensor histidine kinase [Phytomonospora sp. NPDC050363]|uniref:sensor histidine kinase n=1 Tax=Phytomonospora sp. NPDC050363 TaxID=3155642 RepID=UPI00340AA576
MATTVGDASQAGTLRSLVVLSSSVGKLSHLLQTERSSAVETLLGHKDSAAEIFLADTHVTDDAAAEYFAERTSMPDLPASVDGHLDRVDRQLAELHVLRENVVAGTVAASATAFRYQIIIGDMVTYRENIAQTGGAQGEIADQIRAAAALAAAAEYAGAERTTVQRALARGRLLPATQQEITADRSGYIEAMRLFNDLALPEWRGWVEQSLSGMEAVQAQIAEDDVARTKPGQRLVTQPVFWSQAMNARLAHLHLIQDLVDRDVIDVVTEMRDGQRLWAGLQAGAVLLTVALALWLAVRLGRPVVRGLRRLRDAAHRVAAVDLPEAVAKLNDGDSIGNRTPDQFAADQTKLLPAKGADELAEVARAFNAVHTEAVRVAAEQAVLRLHIARMFVELARRGNSLTGRLTKALDEAEHREENPEWLERLFAFDHMVTLLSRRNNSLLVLGGSSPAQARVRDEPVADVLKAAQGQVEHYTRVHFAGLAEGVAVKASLVDEMVILLAELVDNATRFSQHVTVSASALADRTIIQISDDGIGIKPPQREKLNGRLAYPRLDLDALHTMGMTVVGTIATRHGITVELRDNKPKGTIAEVTVPAALLSKEQPRDGDSGGPAAPLFRRVERAVPAEAETTAEVEVDEAPVPTLLFAGTGSPGGRNEPTSVADEDTAEVAVPPSVRPSGTVEPVAEETPKPFKAFENTEASSGASEATQAFRPFGDTESTPSTEDTSTGGASALPTRRPSPHPRPVDEPAEPEAGEVAAAEATGMLSKGGLFARRDTGGGNAVPVPANGYSAPMPSRTPDAPANGYSAPMPSRTPDAPAAAPEPAPEPEPARETEPAPLAGGLFERLSPTNGDNLPARTPAGEIAGALQQTPVPPKGGYFGTPSPAPDAEAAPPADAPDPEPATEVESAARPEPADSDPAPAAATLTDQETVALPIITPSVPSQRRPAEDGWTNISDAASALLSPTGELPRRAPMAHLVPGGLPDDHQGAAAVPTPQPSDYRDPDSVGATFAAYARGTSSIKQTMSMTTTDREPDSDRA